MKENFVVTFVKNRSYCRMNFLNKLTNDQRKELKGCIQSEEDKLAVRRSQAIVLLEERVSASTIEAITGYKREVVVKTRRIFVKNGIKSLLSKRKKKEHQAFLTQNQKDYIVHILNSKTPEEFGYRSQFWTTTILGDLILEQYNVKYKSKTSIYLIFRKAKFTFHKPEKVSEKRDEKLIQQWKDEKLPILNEECKRDDTVVLVGDEAAISSQTRTQKVWLPVNGAAVVEDTTKRKMVHFYGFLNVQSGEAFAYKTKAQTGEITISVLKKLARIYPHKRIVIIWDNASWHKSRAVREFLSKTKQFKLYNFPPYAPELNPQEHVWKEMRDKVLNNQLIKDIDIAAKRAIQFVHNAILKYSFFSLHGTFNV